MASIVNEFIDPFEQIEWIACDTETYTYIDGKRLTEQEIERLGKLHPFAWFKQHTSVKAYAWLISDGRRFAWFDCFDDWCKFCADHQVKSVWWYNCKFDFAIIDYEMLSTGKWTAKAHKGKLKAFEYDSLHNDFGGRYCLKLCYPYKKSGRKNDRHNRAHQWANYDFCNIFGGGLAKNLKSFNVTDFDGTPVRKLEMDYQADTDANAVQYMRNDVDGLFHLVRIASEWLHDNVMGYTLAGGKPDIMTAGGLAKKVLLKYLYGQDDRRNKQLFMWRHKCDIEIDTYYRVRGLYRGGITYLNPRYAGDMMHAPMWRYDINSMYPDAMYKMPDIVSYAKRITVGEWSQKYAEGDKDHIFILFITDIHARKREKMLPLFPDPLTRDFTPFIDYTGQLTMFDFEFIEIMQHWYTVDEYTIDYVLQYDIEWIDGYKSFIGDFYKMKADAKRDGDKIKQAFSKLLLNSSYGKLAENPRRRACHREIDKTNDCVIMVNDEVEIDEDNMMSILQGAYVTAYARVHLMSLIRDVCHDDPEQYFIYCDTDSIHALVPYDKCDPYELGALKDETDGAPFNCYKYLAPKTYFDAHQDADGNILDLEMHTKGVSIKTVEKECKNGEQWKTANEIDKIFDVGVRFQPLTAINVSGGKALIPIEKYLCRDDNLIKYNIDDLEELLCHEQK